MQNSKVFANACKGIINQKMGVKSVVLTVNYALTYKTACSVKMDISKEKHLVDANNRTNY